MMEMADYWLLEKQLVHKLFKVLVPRFESYRGPVTKIFNAPREYPAAPSRSYFKRSILELRGNPYPPILPDASYRNKHLIHNVLLEAAMREFKAEEREKKLESQEQENETEKVQMIVEEKSKE